MGEIDLISRIRRHQGIRRLGRTLLSIVGISAAIVVYLIVLTRGAIL